MRNITLAASALVAATVAQPASAATMVLQQSNCVQFCLFDPFLAGTINSIAYSVSYTGGTGYRALPNGPQDTSSTARLTGEVTFLGAPGKVVVDEIQTSPIFGDGSVSFGIQGSYAVTLLNNFSYFTNGQFLVGASPNITVTRISGAGIGQAFYGRLLTSASLLIDYTPSVPEPSTWAMMLAGFAMTGYALRHRRATVAVA